MIHRKTYQYKLNPTKAQQQVFGQWVGSCRYVYNLSLEYKKTLYKHHKTSIGRNDMQKELCRIAADTPWFRAIHSQTLQDVVERLYRAYDTYFRNLKSGEIDRMKAVYVAKCKRRNVPVNPVKLARMGKVNFAKKGEYRSFTLKQDVKLHPNTNRIQLPKIGKVKYRNSRSIEGVIKTATVIEKADGWYVSLSCETEMEPLPPKGGDIGIDVGIDCLAALSTGEKIENPKHTKKYGDKLARLQRSVERKVKGSSNQRKAKKKVALCHLKIANTRKDYLHKLSTRLVRENQSIGVEDLKIRNMVQNHTLAKSISDASWGILIGMVEYKTGWYGRYLGKENPYNTSKTCSCCGHVVDKMPLSVRQWTCPSCETKHDRDVNAAMNILKRMQDRRGTTGGSSGDMRPQ